MRYRIVEVKKKFYLQRYELTSLTWTVWSGSEYWWSSKHFHWWNIYDTYEEALEDLEIFRPKVISTF